MIKKLLFLIILVVVLVLALPTAIGYYLSPLDKLERVDTIVVVSGGETELRVEEGVSLYKAKYAPKIIFSGAAKEGEVSNALAMKRLAIKAGVPAEDILIEENSKDTKENAINTSLILKQYNFKSIILTTSPYHQKRAHQLFKKYSPEVKIINWSSKDSNWRKFGWWRNDYGVKLTISELMKTLYINSKD